MPLTTPTLVKGVIKVTGTTNLSPFIAAAEAVINDQLAALPFYVANPGKLVVISTWLSAHFYAILKPRATQEQAGTVMQSLQSKVDLGLNVTHYGQMAMRLDSTGTLAAFDNALKDVKKPLSTGTVKLTAHWAGKDRCPDYPGACD